MNPQSQPSESEGFRSLPKSKWLSQLSNRPFSWFGLGMAGVFLLAAVLRFWGLIRFNTLVFDEVYYAKFGINYLEGVSFFDAHPPVGKYAIALGIWIGERLPFAGGMRNWLTGTLLSPFSYRWLNAFTGSLIPVIAAGIAYQLSHRRSLALIAGLLTAADGLLLVESRYALINIYLVFFGLLGQWLFLVALERRGRKRIFLLAAAGACLGASVAVKWNGLGFLVGVYLVLLAARAQSLLDFISVSLNLPSPNPKSKSKNPKSPLQQNLTQLNFLPVLLCLGVVPAAVYSLAWIPHLQLDPKSGFWEVHEQILQFHRAMKNGEGVHPYCSAWYTWPVMFRPMVYVYEKARNTVEAVPAYPPLPEGAGKVIYDVHAMGNPVLWWLSSAAMLLLFFMLAHRLWVEVFGRSASRQPVRYPVPAELWAVFYLVVNYAANWLPWVLVTRCTFIYLYMGASVFSFLGLAWAVERWLRSYQIQYRAIGVTVIFAILLALVFWLPVYWGLPLSQGEFDLRMWFRSWI
ncbi:MAG: phospholipid carrier-dependent glycosyltransferase [Oscillatoria sp. Prado101]|nr:phospholipid carrier-dependent glycosyltransferase [Oscillatoria sp. Prado101]